MPVNLYHAANAESAAPQVKWSVPGSATLNALTLPTGVTGYPIHSEHAQYKLRHYLVGAFSSNLTFLEETQTVVTTGISAPTAAPGLATGAAGLLTGSVIAYLTFKHKLSDGTLVAESDPSPASSTVVFASQQASITSIPTTGADARTTHVGIYFSVDGASARFAADEPYGTASTTINIAVGSLGVVVPSNHGVPPVAIHIAKYHDRMWYVSRTNQERIYYSEIGEPEAVGSSSYLLTRDGEASTGIARVRDQLATFCYRCTYDIQGYTSSDFNVRKVHPEWGCISAPSIVNIAERLFFAAEDGVCIYDGASFLYTMKDIRSYWADDRLANIARYNDLAAANDRQKHVYRLLLRKETSPKSFYYVGHYLGLEEGKPIRWTFDVRTREDEAVGEVDGGSGKLQSHTGSCDGYIRQENVDSNADDDGDSYAKKYIVRPGVDLFDDVGAGGEITMGKTFTDMDLFMESDSAAPTLKLYPGEENALDALNPAQTITLPTGASSSGSQTFLGRQQWPLSLVGISGVGLGFQLEGSSATGVKYRGWDTYWKDGPGTRPRKT